MDDEALQKQSDPISIADVAWKIREALEHLETNSVVLPQDQGKKTEMFKSLSGLLCWWAMCAGGTVTCNTPSDVDEPKDDSKELVDETKDKGQGNSGMKRPRRCNGGFPRDDDDEDSQSNAPVVKRKKTQKKSCVKLNRKKMGGSKRRKSSSSSSASCFEVEVVVERPVTMTIASASSSSSSSDDDAEGGNAGGKTNLTSSSESSESD